MSECTKRKYSVEIFNQTYTLVSDEPEEHLVRVGAYVDGVMRDIARQAAMSDMQRVAVLASLQMASKLIRLEQEHDKRAREGEELMARIDAALQVDPAHRP